MGYEEIDHSDLYCFCDADDGYPCLCPCQRCNPHKFDGEVCDPECRDPQSKCSCDPLDNDGSSDEH